MKIKIKSSTNSPYRHVKNEHTVSLEISLQFILQSINLYLRMVYQLLLVNNSTIIKRDLLVTNRIGLLKSKTINHINVLMVYELIRYNKDSCIFKLPTLVVTLRIMLGPVTISQTLWWSCLPRQNLYITSISDIKNFIKGTLKSKALRQRNRKLL